MAGRLTDTMDQQVRYIPLAELDVSEFNVRRRDITADLDDLVKSLNDVGLYQPIVVAPKDNNRFTIVIGQRRYLAAKQLRWDMIPALVLSEPLEKVKATILSFGENVQRRELAPQDKSDACLYLRHALGSTGAVADALGVSEQTVRKWLGFAAVPDSIRALVRPGRMKKGGITVQQAMRIAEHVQDEQDAIDIAQRIATEPLKTNRDRVLESAAELPGRSSDTIFRRAEEKKTEKRITFVLTESSALAIDEASFVQQTGPNDIAMSATIQWLQDNKYLR